MKLLMILALGLTLNASSIITTIGAKSNHLIEGDFNENHNWLGLGYRFIEKDDYGLQVEYASFVNSYNDDTEFIALTAIYTPIVLSKVKLGLSGSIGYQRGYYTNSEGTIHPDKAKRLGISNESILVLYSFYGELDNLIVNYTYIPNSVEAITVGFKLMEW